MKPRILIFSHGGLAEELLKVAYDITGKKSGVEALGVYRCQSAESVKSRFSETVERLVREGSLLVLTDMLGGTPSNITMRNLVSGRMEVVSGVNLPMLIVALQKKDTVSDVKELASVVSRAGRRSCIDCRKEMGV